MLGSLSPEEVDLLDNRLLLDPYRRDEDVREDDRTDDDRALSYIDTSKEHLKYVLPFVPANILITGGTLVSGKLLTDAGSEVIAALPYIYGFYGLTQSANTLFVGTGVSAANAHGEGDIGRINTILKQSMLIAGGLSIPFLAMLYQGGNLSRLIGAPTDVANVVQTHLNQYAWGVPLYFINAGLTQTTIPYSTVPSSVNMIANTVSSCGLSFLFTKGTGFIPPMPIAGTALALSVTNTLNDLGFFGYMLSQSEYREIMANQSDSSHMQSFKSIMNIGLPTALNTFGQMASGMVATTTISALLDETALQQQGLTTMPMAFLQILIAFNGDAAAVLISDQVGQQNYRNIKKYVNTAHTFGAVSGLLGTALIAGLAEPYVRYFADPSIATPEFISTTRNLLLLSSLNQTISSAGVTSAGSLRGIDENWKPLLINLGLKVGLNLLGSYMLMSTTDLGVYSPYVSDLIVSSLFYSPSLYYYCRQKVSSYIYEHTTDEVDTAPADSDDLEAGEAHGHDDITLDHRSSNQQQTSYCSSFLGWLYPNSSPPATTPVETEALADEPDEPSRSNSWRRWFC